MVRGLHRKKGPLGLALLCAVALSPQSADAAEFKPSISPRVLVGKPPWKVTYQLEVATGAEAEQIELVSPSWQVKFSGAATVRNEGKRDLFPPRTLGCGSASEPRLSQEYDYDLLDLPAQSHSFARISLVLRDYPHIDEDLDETFGIAKVAADGTRTALPAVTVTGPSVTVPTTLGIGIEVPRRLQRQDPYDRQAFQLRGTADRRAAGQAVEFRFTSTNAADGRSKLISRVRVGARGRFSYLWRPNRPGHYMVGIRYRSQDRRFVTSVSRCSVAVKATSPRRHAMRAVATAAPRDQAGAVLKQTVIARTQPRLGAHAV